jgi:hypothetical protein
MSISAFDGVVPAVPDPPPAVFEILNSPAPGFVV